MKFKRDKDKDKNVNIEFSRYLVFSSIIVLLFFLIFVVNNLDYVIVKEDPALKLDQDIGLEYQENIASIHREGEGLGADSFILVQSQQKARPAIKDKNKTTSQQNISMVEDGLKKAKIPYRTALSLKEIKDPKGSLILDGKMLKSHADLEVLQKFIQKEYEIIFLTMPDLDFIKEHNLEKMLGIRKIKGLKLKKELTLVPGFMLGGLHEFEKMPYKSAGVELLAGTKVYAYGEVSPVIWRNMYKGSGIYLVNGPFMKTKISYGILSALMSEIYPDYIYPVINARLTTYEGLPYISHENTDSLEENYNRDAMKLQQDILLPDILSINRKREFIPNAFLRVGFEDPTIDLDPRKISQTSYKQINNHKAQIYKPNGEIGMTYSGDIEADKRMYKYLFKDKEINSLLIPQEIFEIMQDLDNEPAVNGVQDKNNEQAINKMHNVKSMQDLNNILNKCCSIKAILGPWSPEAINFEYIDEDTVYIPIMRTGVENANKAKLELISKASALGIIVQNLNLEDVVLADERQANWRKISKKYVKSLDEYRLEFNELKDRNITETSQAIKIFLNSSPQIKQSKDQIVLEFTSWHADSYYILRTDKKIGPVKNAKVVEIEEGAYLVTALDKEVEINLSPQKKDHY